MDGVPRDGLAVAAATGGLVQGGGPLRVSSVGWRHDAVPI